MNLSIAGEYPYESQEAGEGQIKPLTTSIIQRQSEDMTGKAAADV